jgi:pimeloyl-ACP methyl ester carboxylesterase
MLLGKWATERLLALAVAMHAAVPPATLTKRLRAIVGVDHTALLARVQVPVLALCASQDRLVPKAATTWIRAHLPALDIVTLQGPHWLLQTRPDAAVQAITAFLARSGQPAV